MHRHTVEGGVEGEGGSIVIVKAVRQHELGQCVMWCGL